MKKRKEDNNVDNGMYSQSIRLVYDMNLNNNNMKNVVFENDQIISQKKTTQLCVSVCVCKCRIRLVSSIYLRTLFFGKNRIQSENGILKKRNKH